MNHAEAVELAWSVAVPIVKFLGSIAVLLVGLAVIGEIRR